MKYLSFHEKKRRGTFDFPIELYHIDASHPRYEMPIHWHVESELILIVKGSFQLFIDGTSRTLSPGDCIFLSSGMLHGGMPEGCVYQCLVLDYERFFQDSTICRARFQSAFGNEPHIQSYFEAGSEGAVLIERIFTAMQGETRGYEFLTTGLLWQFTAFILQCDLYQKSPLQSEHNGTRIDQIKRVLGYIRIHYAENLTLQILADRAQMTPKYFCRIFKQVTGRTPIDYLNYYRIECAAELLCASDETVTEIALACGFGDLSYFIRVFQKYKGMSTKIYQHQHHHLQSKN